MKRLFLSLALGCCTLLGAGGLYGDETPVTTNLGTLMLGGGGTNAGTSSSVETDEFTGAATYTIPIAVPPARGGVTPTISLNYNSYRKNSNSLVGYGWELELGSIVRARPVIGNDSDGITDYQNGRDFEIRLGGQSEKLILFQENIKGSDYGVLVASGMTASVFLAQVESAFTYYILLRDNAKNFDKRWIGVDKSGTKYYFGTNDQSRVANGLNVIRWQLDKVVDANENEVIMDYDDDHHPKSISYQDIKISFTVSDQVSGPVPYFPLFNEVESTISPLTRVLTEIEIKSDSKGQLNRYQLAYDLSPKLRKRRLTSIQQFGATDEESLPEVKFTYFGETDLSFYTGAAAKDAHKDGDYYDGLIGEKSAFADMNGDGLVDHVVAYPDDIDGKDGGYFKIYFNDGNNFVDKGSDSLWNAPFGCYFELDDPCNGKVNAWRSGGDGEMHQWLYLMDMNGDGMADRVVRTQPEIDNGITTAYFHIAFNNGHGFDQDTVNWKDPYQGDWAGGADKDRGFYDMNGDGLVDRVTGDTTGNKFDVRFNTGAGFKQNAVFWNDPIATNNFDVKQVAGLLYAIDGDDTYVFIRDMNGDGLPDRVVSRTMDNKTGFLVFLNKNGQKWANPVPGPDGTLLANGIDVLSIDDPAADTSKGTLNHNHDWIDINGDGFLDRVEGDENVKIIRVFFHRGMTAQEPLSSLSLAVEIPDPVVDGNLPHSDFGATGFFNNSHDSKASVFFQDFNGDGLPDRLAYDWGNGNYQYYPMHHNAVLFSDSPDWWGDKFVSQPLGALQSINDGRGGESEIAYQPSSFLKVQGVPNHRFLPFNLNVVRKIFTRDPTFSLGPVLNSPYPEAQTHPWMRWITYDFYGGNFSVLHAEKANKDLSASSDPTLVPGKTHFARFNGFQKVIKTPAKGDGETWTPYQIETRYHQSTGDAGPSAIGSNKASLDFNGYGLLSKAGRPYLMTVTEEGKEIVRQESTWGLVEYDTLADPNKKYWWPHLASQKKIVKDSTSQARTTRIDYTYDNSANVLSEKVMDGDGNEILTKGTDYYNFDATVQIRDRPKTQKKSKDGSVLRTKSFAYDTKGNPTTETLETGSQALKITRTFDSQGKMTSLTDVDGVTKKISYENNLFPVKETMVGAGKSLIVNRQFERRTGETKDEEGPQKVGKRVVYDSFGRPELEYLRDANGDEQLVKKYAYQYVTASGPTPTEGVAAEIILLKTSVWKITPEDSDTTAGHEAEISYSDAGGQVLQQCTRSERGDYRRIQKRSTNAGRVERTTEPVFAANCDYLVDLDDTAKRHRVEKDLQGRVTLIDPPDGDSGSPVGDTTFTYKNLAGSQLEKTTTHASGQVYVEVFDINDRLFKVTDPNKGTIEYEYNAVGDLTKVTGNGTKLTEMTYDQLGRKTSMWDVDMGYWTYSYDDKGHLSVQTDANKNKIQYSYDSLGRVTQKQSLNSKNEVERTETYTYDTGAEADGYSVKDGELAKVEEKDGSNKLLRSTSFSYDNYRRTNKIARYIVTSAAGGTTFEQTLEYDFLGKVVTNTFPNDYSLFYQYMTNGNLKTVCTKKECDPAKDEFYYSLDPQTAYDQYGNLQGEKYGNGVISTYSYYPNSHRLKEKKVGGPDATVLAQKQYEHDTLSNLTKIDDPGGTAQGFSAAIQNVKYDPLNRLTAFDQDGKSLSLTYDGWGNIKTNAKYFGNSEYTYDPDKIHRVTKIGDKAFGYDANGNITSDPYRTMAYNTRNQLAQVQMKNGTIVGYDYDYTGSRVRKDVTTEDPLKVKTSSTTHFLGDAMELKGTQLILHIFAGQRKVATRVLTPDFKLAAAAGGSNLVYSGIETRWDLPQVTPYFFVLLTLFLLGSLRPVPVPSPFGERVRVRGRQPWLGNLRIFSPLCKGGRRGVDPGRWFVSIYQAWCRYRTSLQDAIAVFHERSWTKAFVLFLMFLSVVQPPTLAFAGDSGEPDPNYNDSEYFYYVHDDHLGSSMLLTEGKDQAKHAGLTFKKGQILQRFEYSPFGGEIYALNPNLKFDPSYTGQRYDIETGLYYYQSRYYDPVLGRFIQPDTVVPDAKDLQAYNRYSYVRNNPLKYVDPSGHSWFKKLFAAFIGAFISVITGFVLAPFMATLWVGVIAGAVGGLVSGAITGGLKGALLGGIFGALGGLAFGGMNIGLEKLGMTNQWARIAVMAGIGAGLSAATGGWQGLVIFGAGLAGAAAGYGVGKPIGAKVGAWKAARDNGLTFRPGRAHFDYSQGGGGGSGQLAGNGTGGNDLLGLAPDVATDAFFNAGSGNYGSQAAVSGAAGGGYLDINISGGNWLGLTGGILISKSGIYPYFGGGLVSPGVSGSITWSPSAVSTGWNVGAQFQAGIAGQLGYSFGGGRFGEIGVGWLPGASATGYYVFGP